MPTLECFQQFSWAFIKTWESYTLTRVWDFLLCCISGVYLCLVSQEKGCFLRLSTVRMELIIYTKFKGVFIIFLLIYLCPYDYRQKIQHEKIEIPRYWSLHFHNSTTHSWQDYIYMRKLNQECANNKNINEERQGDLKESLKLFSAELQIPIYIGIC